jgi:hypothetical protein
MGRFLHFLNGTIRLAGQHSPDLLVKALLDVGKSVHSAAPDRVKSFKVESFFRAFVRNDAFWGASRADRIERSSWRW